jgi:hypothetical protein
MSRQAPTRRERPSCPTGLLRFCHACPGEVLTRVAVIVVEGSLGGDNDSIVWSISKGPSAGNESAFAIGQAPVGWITETPLTGEIPNDTVVQFMNSHGSSTQFALSLDRLHVGSVWDGATELAPEEFLAAATEAC